MIAKFFLQNVDRETGPFFLLSVFEIEDHYQGGFCYQMKSWAIAAGAIFAIRS